MRICWSRSLALTSSSRWIGLPESRVRKNTMLITTSMLSTVWSTRPIRYLHMLAGPADVFPVVEPHVPGDHGPVPDSGPQPRDRVGRPDRDTRHVFGEPRAHLVAHGAQALRVIRLARKPVDELVELRLLDEQAQPGLRIPGAVQHPHGSGATRGDA